MFRRLRRWWQTSPTLCRLGLHVYHPSKRCPVCGDWDE